MEVRCHESSTCMHYVWYKLWPIGYRKLCTSCFTMISFVLHRLAMPWTTDNGKSIKKQTCSRSMGTGSGSGSGGGSDSSSGSALVCTI